jgi:hypothetical protein
LDDIRAVFGAMAIGRSDRSSGRWAALALHLAVTYAITFPAAHHVATSFFGWGRGDRYQFIWIFWWVKRALVDLEQLPFFSSTT